jgi:glycosyltransferase involved in cell wall biosynthesis
LGHTVACGIAWNQDNKMLSVEDADHKHLFPDVVILQRVMHDGLANTIKAARANGQIVINDLDDWYWGLDPSNEAFHHSHPKNNTQENTRFYASTLAASSLLTVSTPYLRDRIARRVHCPMVVIPNYVDLARFTPVTQTEGVPTFGWAGSTAHRSGDIETLRGVIKGFVESGQIKIHHSGSHPGAPSFAAGVGLDVDQVGLTERVQFFDYPKLLHFDVGLIPLRDAPFNHAKSDIKGLEYAASGIPFIASALSAYRELYEQWSPDPGFFLAKRGYNWIKGIEALTDYETRLRYQSFVLDWVKQRDISYGVQAWKDLLAGLAS